jgi:hypothetical protein
MPGDGIARPAQILTVLVDHRRSPSRFVTDLPRIGRMGDGGFHVSTRYGIWAECSLPWLLVQRPFRVLFRLFSAPFRLHARG